MIKKRLSFLWIWIFLFALILTAFASCAKAPRREEGEPLAASDPAGWKNASGDPKERVIVLDPGHGYADPGALADGTAEKDVTLAIALSVREKLERYGFTVFMTREDDAIPDGEDGSYLLKPSMRASFAESLESFDLFLSFHADAFVSDLSVRGTRFYRYAGEKPARRNCVRFSNPAYTPLSAGRFPL